MNTTTCNWPERPICHDGDFMAQRFGQTTYARRDDGYQHCSYCGSLHPRDLLDAIASGATLSGSDWKYGWPHKFYLHGGKVGHAKFYNIHLMDLDDESFIHVRNVLTREAGIEFFKEEGQLMFRAPHAGYQRY